jgi:hypothetical protein
MRRVFAAMTGLFLLASMLGCCHTCGVCDCAPYAPCAGGCCIGGDHAAPGAAIIRPEPLRVAPKAGEQ